MRTNSRLRSYIGAAAFLGLLMGFAPAAQATLTSDQCDLTTGNPLDRPLCSTANPNLAVTLPTYDAARADPGLAGPPIDAWNICRYVDNFSAHSLFVPFRTSPEWVAFVTHTEPGFGPITCSRPGSLLVPDNYAIWPDGAQNPYYDTSAPDRTCDTAQVASAKLHYARTAATATAMEQFTCTVKGLCDDATPPSCGADQTWQLTATATFTAGVAYDNGNAQPSGGWMLTNVVYSGTKPDANSVPVAGQCGSANGVASSSAPALGLCSAGTASAISESSDSTLWTWSCAGTDGGAITSCSAPVTCGGGGVHVGGYCWYLGASGASCDTTCVAHGGSNNATVTYAGSAGTNANCNSVLNALGVAYGPSTFDDSECNSGLQYAGCVFNSSPLPTRLRCTNGTTTTSASLRFEYRACACNN